MKLPSFKRIRSSDFKEEDRQIIDQISPTINDGLDRLYFVMNSGISLKDNVDCQVSDIEVVVNSSGVVTSGASLRLNKTTVVFGCQVIKAENLSNSSVFPTGCPFITYAQNNSNLVLNHITGLQSGNTYRLRVVVYY